MWQDKTRDKRQEPRARQDKDMEGGSDLELRAVPGFGFLPEKVVVAADLLFQVNLDELDFHFDYFGGKGSPNRGIGAEIYAFTYTSN